VARVKKPGCIRALGTVVTLTDAEGNVVGERMDNLIHASATVEEGEREVKLWFKPEDIPPLMHIYPTALSSEFYYYKDNRLYMAPEPDSICFLAPHDIAWESDLDALRKINQGVPQSCTLEAIVAKYLINRADQAE
jgi:nucleoside-diphosphate kinase